MELISSFCSLLPVPAFAYPPSPPQCEEEEGEGVFAATLLPQGRTHLV